MNDRAALLKGIRAWLVLFVVCLVLSGATAFPLVHELRWTEDVLRSLSVPHYLPTLMDWIVQVRQGLDTADTDYPFLALICGPIRGIPFWWTVIDMSFGIIGIVPLYVVRKKIKRLEAATPAPTPAPVMAA